MARIIMFSSYLKGNEKNHKGSYIKYMGTREGVQEIPLNWENENATKSQIDLIEKMTNDFGDDIKDSFEYQDFLSAQTKANASALISTILDTNFSLVEKKENYIDYIANRPRVQKISEHGLFSQDDVVDIDEVADEVSKMSNNMFISIFSLKREDAARLGYDDARMWRDMLRSQIPTIAHNYKIPLSDFCWYAAFHDEGHHPHVHFVCYSAAKDGFLTEKGIEKIKSSLAHQIFSQDFEEIYEKKDMARNEVSKESQNILDDIILKIEKGNYENKNLEKLLLNLSLKLDGTNGKKQYGFLPKDCKNIVDAILKELSSDEDINKLYDLWYEQKEAIISTYKKNMPERIPIELNDEFKTVKNIIIREALNLSLENEKFSVEINPLAQIKDLSDDAKELDFAEQASAQNIGLNDDFEDLEFIEKTSAQNKDFFAKYTEEYMTARTYLYGNEVIEQNYSSALKLLKDEALQGNALAMYDVANIYFRGLGLEIDTDEAQKWFKKAFDSFLSIEKAGANAFLEYRLGKMLSQGYGVEQNSEKAFSYYLLSANKNSSLGQYGLGSAYFHGKGVEQSYADAIAQFTLSAANEKSPNAFAQYELGKIYEKGIGTEPNAEKSYNCYEKALEEFKRSLSKRNVDSLQYRVGQMHFYGKGCDIDLDKAFLRFSEATKMKNPDAFYGLGQLYFNKSFSKYDTDKAVEALSKAAELNNQFAKYLLGKTYLVGEHVSKDVNKAMELLERSAEDGNSQAEYLLGRTYLIGKDVPKDIEKALKYLNSAVEKDNQFAKYLLGKTYLVGEHVSKDVNKAMKLLERSAEDGNSQAEYLLGRTYLLGKDTSLNIVRAVTMLERASNQNNSLASYLLGKTLLEGKVIPKNVDRALNLLNLSSEQGCSPAKVTLALSYLKGEDVIKNIDLAKELLKQAADDGNKFAQKMLEEPDRSPLLQSSIGSLLYHTSKIISSATTHSSHSSAVDRKEMIKIMKKKAAEGLKYN